MIIKLKRLSSLFVFIGFLLSVNIIQGQVVKEDTTKSNQNLYDNGKELQFQFPNFRVMVSPNISLWTPLSGDDTENYGVSLKYGIKCIVKITDELLAEMGYSFSSLGIKENVIRGNFENYYSDEVTNFNVESSNNNEHQLFGGVAFAFKSIGQFIPYLRIGAGYYTRGNTTATYSGSGPNSTFHGNIEIFNNESGMSIYSGYGMTILMGNNIAFDYQLNANVLLFNSRPPSWFEFVVALNILFE